MGPSWVLLQHLGVLVRWEIGVHGRWAWSPTGCCGTRAKVRVRARARARARVRTIANFRVRVMVQARTRVQVVVV